MFSVALTQIFNYDFQKTIDIQTALFNAKNNTKKYQNRNL